MPTCPGQVNMFYEAVGCIVSAEQNPTKRDEIIQELFRLPNARWLEIIGLAMQDPTQLQNQDTMRRRAPRPTTTTTTTTLSLRTVPPVCLQQRSLSLSSLPPVLPLSLSPSLSLPPLSLSSSLTLSFALSSRLFRWPFAVPFQPATVSPTTH